MATSSSHATGAASHAEHDAAFLEAVCTNNLDQVKLAVKNGANVHAVDRYQQNAVYLAAERGFLAMMVYCSDVLQVHPDKPNDDNGTTAIMVAVQDATYKPGCKLAAEHLLKRPGLDLTRCVAVGDARTVLNLTADKTLLTALRKYGAVKHVDLMLPLPPPPSYDPVSAMLKGCVPSPSQQILLDSGISAGAFRIRK